MSGVGIARCVVIVVLAMALLVVVAKADKPWVAPVASAVLLLFYNNERRDRRFLAAILNMSSLCLRVSMCWLVCRSS